MPTGQFDRGPGSRWYVAMQRARKKPRFDGEQPVLVRERAAAVARELAALTAPTPPRRGPWCPSDATPVSYWRFQWTRTVEYRRPVLPARPVEPVRAERAP